MDWLAEEREGDLAAAIAATLDKVCVWEGNNNIFNRTKSPPSGPCVHMGMWLCFWTNMEASFCKKQWNMVTLLQANYCILLSGCTMQRYSKSKATDLAGYTRNMSSYSGLHWEKIEGLCVWSL